MYAIAKSYSFLCVPRMSSRIARTLCSCRRKLGLPWNWLHERNNRKIRILLDDRSVDRCHEHERRQNGHLDSLSLPPPPNLPVRRPAASFPPAHNRRNVGPIWTTQRGRNEIAITAAALDEKLVLALQNVRSKRHDEVTFFSDLTTNQP